MQWSDLNEEQKNLLAAWYILADASPPERGEPLPIEATQALAELAYSAGKVKRYRFEKQIRGGTLPGSHVTSNRKRVIKRRKAVGALAT